MRRPASVDPWYLYGWLVLGTIAALVVAEVFFLPARTPVGPDVLALPSRAHLLGTDADGRDLLTLIAHGQPQYLVLGSTAALLAVGVGTALGLVAGLTRPAADAAVRYACDVLASFPRIAFLLLVATAVDTSLRTATLALGLSFVPAVTGEVRQQLVALRQAEFLAAARAHGIDWFRLVTYQILWVHLRPRLIRQAAFVFAYVVLIDAALSYIGSLTGYVRIGEPPPGGHHTLGQVMATARDIVDTSLEDLRTWWPLTVLAGYMTLLVTGLLAFGESLVRRAES